MQRLGEAIGSDTGSGTVELWGGHECTVNRVGDQWFDQTVRSGHHHRIDDLRLFADLGVRSLRYPVLWERVSPHHPEARAFGWTDERLAEIGRLGMNPIVTLCHHGSGPRYTSLIDDGFAPGLAAHAAAVARRYPWVRDYTPINEPLTTARFSALYGFWYPHICDEATFWRALLNQIDATRLAMREIRKVRPDARLIQTDDIGFCHATAPLREEADFQNQRRWMGWDLLCGMVRPGHALWPRLTGFGLEDRLRAIADDPCAPDVIGLNHYLSSERLLDHRIAQHGGRATADRNLGRCGDVVHVDVDAARCVPDDVVGLRRLIEQAARRYGRPVAVTECHLGSTREDQARWFIDAWDIARDLRAGGVDICAVTAWSLLGAHDWNRLVTRPAGHYETGVFDVRQTPPRPTLMARVLKDLATGRRPSGPGLDEPGWWRKHRGAAPADHDAHLFEMMADRDGAPPRRPLLILAGDGVLAALAADACRRRDLHHQIRHDARRQDILATHPWAVLDTRRPPGEMAPGAAPFEEVRRACATLGIVHAVFIPADMPVADAHPGALAVQVGRIFTPDDPDAWPVRLLDALDAGRRVQACADAPWTGSYGPAVVDGVLDLLLDGACGPVDFLPADCASEAALARALATAADCAEDLVEHVGDIALLPPPRARVSYLPATESVLERFVRERRAVRGRDAPADAASRHEPSLEAAE